MPLLRQILSILLITVTILPVQSQQQLRQYQNESGFTPGSHTLQLPSPSTPLWRFTLAHQDCQIDMHAHAVITLPTDRPEGETVTLTSNADNGNCPASMTLCSSAWRGAKEDAKIKVNVVSSEDIGYSVSLSPIIERELVLDSNNSATINGTIHRKRRNLSESSEMYFTDLSNRPRDGQLEISVESDDVPRSARGRKRDRKTKKIVPRFVASLVVSAFCPACSRRTKMLMGGDDYFSSPSTEAPFLSFTTYGKVTISKNSVPSLTDSNLWFIAVSPSTKTNFSALANVTAKRYRLSVAFTLPVSQSLYVAPLVVVSFIVGVVFIFIDVVLLYVRYQEFRKDQATSKAMSTLTFIFKNLRLYFYNSVCWFKRGTKTFPYLVLIFGITLFVPGLQTILGTLSQRWETGELDLCYYNEKCYVAASSLDFPENSVLSNAAYVVHGILFVLLYSFVETSCRARGHFEVDCVALACRVCHAKPNADYSLAYALGWTLIFQGLFSGIYHLCPTRRAVQFDQSFMFVLSILIVVAVLRGSLKIIEYRSSSSKSSSAATSPTSPLSPQKLTKEMRSPKIFLFLFFLCPLVVFNYVGTLQNEKEIPVYGKVMTPWAKSLFGFFLFLWIAIVLGWAAYKLRFKDRVIEMFFPPLNCKGCSCCSSSAPTSANCGSPASEAQAPNVPSPPTRREKLLFLLSLTAFLGYCLFIVNFVYSAFKKDDDMAKMFVGATLISALASVVAAEMLAAHFVWSQRSTVQPFNRYVGSILFFYLLVAIAWGFAFWFFKKENPSKKEIEPWISRERNKDCIFGDYFDGHEVWHICSSFGIFLMCIRVVHLSNPCPVCFRERFVEEPLKQIVIAAIAVAKWKRRVLSMRRGKGDYVAEVTEGEAVVPLDDVPEGDEEERRIMNDGEEKETQSNGDSC